MTHSNPPDTSAPTQATPPRHWRAYGLSVLVGIALISAWFIGPDAALWAASQNRPAREFPALNLESLGQTETYMSTEQALGDQLRAKSPVVRFLNESALTTTGLTLSSRMTNGNPLPSLFPVVGIDTTLFYGEDFTLPCSRDQEAMRAGMTKWESELDKSEKMGLVVVPPNKSTVLLGTETPWANALMTCSVAGRADLVDMASEFSSLRLISPEEVLAASPNLPYWTGDTHWAPASAETLVSSVQERFRGVVAQPAQDGAPREIVMSQDLLFMLGIDHQLSVTSANPPDDIVNLEEMSTKNGSHVWKFETVGAPISAPTALLVVDSFTYSTGITAKLLSQFKSGYMIQWTSFEELSNLDPVEVIVLEAVERYAYTCFVSMGDPALSAYIARPVK